MEQEVCSYFYFEILNGFTFGIYSILSCKRGDDHTDRHLARSFWWCACKIFTILCSIHGALGIILYISNILYYFIHLTFLDTHFTNDHCFLCLWQDGCVNISYISSIMSFFTVVKTCKNIFCKKTAGDHLQFGACN